MYRGGTLGTQLFTIVILDTSDERVHKSCAHLGERSSVSACSIVSLLRHSFYVHVGRLLSTRDDSCLTDASPDKTRLNGASENMTLRHATHILH